LSSVLILFFTSSPAPVALLKQVCPEAQKRPLPQSMPAGAMVGRAVAPHRNTSANTRMVELFIANDRWGTWKVFSLYCAASKWGSCHACCRYPTAARKQLLSAAAATASVANTRIQ
jgi:hypothetical protein